MSSSFDQRAFGRTERRALELFAEYLRANEAEGCLEELCRKNPALAKELRRLADLWGDFPSLEFVPQSADVDGISSGIDGLPRLEEEPSTDEDVAGRTLRKLAGFGTHDRYVPKGRIADGGQGSVIRVWDKNLRRLLAMKTLHADADGTPDAERAGSRPLARFLEEAFVTGQLDHPGIVPVHELGLDADGHAFFTMKLVKGRDMRSVLADMRRGSRTWTRRRVIDVILRVCEALAYAHAKGVVHRDLKPANVMIGRFGEVYVMDWGLARVLSRADTKDVRIHDQDTTSFVRERPLDEGGANDSPLVTLDGDVVGTPAYMSPEQARGELNEIGPRTDVYAVGAMLYEVCCGKAPYADGRPASNYEIWRRVRAGPPTPLAELAPRTPRELVAICEKAMARSLSRRYADVEALAEHLRAFVEGRVVPVYRTGYVVELSKWVGRNRLLTSAIIAVLLALTAGLGLFAWSQGEAARIAREGQENLQELLDAQRAEDLLAELEESWPVHPRSQGPIEAWIGTVQGLVADLPRLKRDLDELREQALPYDEEQRAADEHARQDVRWEQLRRRQAGMDASIDELLARLERLDLPFDDLAGANRGLEILEPEAERLGRLVAAHDRSMAGRRTWRFGDDALQSEHDALARRVENLERLAGESGLPAVQERLEQCRTLAARSVERYAADWDEAIAAIADRATCPLYEGLRLAPQLGLVPLGPDPKSGLWEFWHVTSGERPRRDEIVGEWVVAAETGIVLVLVPGGEVVIGAQAGDPAGVRYCADASGSDGPPLTVRLDPFFLSKYELTQLQWRRATGQDPSQYYAGFERRGDQRIGPTNPVENVTWTECCEMLALWNLELPTEAQWETAARGGTDRSYPLEGVVQGTVEELQQVVNSQHGADTVANVAGPDGHIAHAPVDSYVPNPYGFFNVIGNVAEWCRDWHSPTFEGKDLAGIRDGDGELLPHDAFSRSTRGGSFETLHPALRVSRRFHETQNFRHSRLGLRPARRVDGLP